MFKNPLAVIAAGVLLAVVANIYLFSTGEELTQVVTQTLFADTIIVLTLVPVVESIRMREEKHNLPIQTRVRSGMKTVALYAFVIAICTFVLFKLFGEPLIAEKLNLLSALIDDEIAKGNFTEQQKAEQLEAANRFYSPSLQVMIVIMANLIVGFISSILAAVLVKK